MADDDRLAGPEIRLPKLGTPSIKPPTAEPSITQQKREGGREGRRGAVEKVTALHLQTQEELPDRPADMHWLVSVNNA